MNTMTRRISGLSFVFALLLGASAQSINAGLTPSLKDESSTSLLVVPAGIGAIGGAALGYSGFGNAILEALKNPGSLGIGLASLLITYEGLCAWGESANDGKVSPRPVKAIKIAVGATALSMAMYAAEAAAKSVK